MTHTSNNKKYQRICIVVDLYWYVLNDLSDEYETTWKSGYGTTYAGPGMQWYPYGPIRRMA